MELSTLCLWGQTQMQRCILRILASEESYWEQSCDTRHQDPIAPPTGHPSVWPHVSWNCGGSARLFALGAFFFSGLCVVSNNKVRGENVYLPLYSLVKTVFFPSLGCRNTPG